MENKHCFLCSYSIPHFFKDGKVTLKSPHGGTEVHEIKLNCLNRMQTIDT